jgi:pimeloyl-ACP methyl ester carboxylesterase
MPPDTRYARSGEIYIAYQVVGDGDVDLLWVPTWIWETEHMWEEPTVAKMLRQLAAFSRLILFDRRGTGQSDPVLGAPTLEEQMDDLVAVMDAVGSERAAVFAMLEAGAMASLFAATNPDRTSALVLWEALPRMSWAPDYDWTPTREQREANIEQSGRDWGSGERALLLSASKYDDGVRQWAGRLERLAASPTTAMAFYRMHSQIDVRPVLPSIQAPTLVMHRPGDTNIDIRHSLYLAEHIPGARLVELPGDHTLPFGPGQDDAVAEIEEFLTGARHAADPERVLATVMFSDIVDSTSRAAALGDRRWRALLESLEGLVTRHLTSHRGRAVKTMGDGFLATTIREVTREQFGLEVRSGLHTGEIELMGSDVGGIAVHIGARILATADPGEVLVSGTVKDLVVGSEIPFEDRGEHDLRGVPGSWRLWAVPG